MNIRMPFRRAMILLPLTLPACTQVPTDSAARLASSTTAPTTAPSLLPQLLGQWKADSVDSGDPLVAGDHPWSLVELTITSDGYTVRRADGTREQGAFSLIES